MARIVIDARESGTTTGRYIDKLIEHLVKLKPAHEIVVLTKPHRMDFMKKIAPDFRIIESPYEEFTFAEQIGFRTQLTGLSPDLIHFGMVQQPMLGRTKAVTTMHDLTTCRFRNPSKNPVVFTLKQQVYKWVNKRAARKSKYVITPTEFVKNDVVSFTGVDPSKVIVTYEAADKITEAAEPIDKLRNKKFIMYVGRPMPHKNLEKLVMAFDEIRKTHPDLYLALAGKKDANYERIETAVKAKKIKNVVFTGFVGDKQLKWMHEHCRAYIFPSLSEGFGLPGLEAMVHGAPVISSRSTCLPEVYGSAAHYFDPTSGRDMADKISEVLDNEGLRQVLIKAGKQQAKKYSWDKMAEQTLAIYEKALSD